MNLPLTFFLTLTTLPNFIFGWQERVHVYFNVAVGQYGYMTGRVEVKKNGDGLMLNVKEITGNIGPNMTFLMKLDADNSNKVNEGSCFEMPQIRCLTAVNIDPAFRSSSMSLNVKNKDGLF